MANAQGPPLLWVSFQDAWGGADDVIHLGCMGTQADIRRQGLVLREGMAVRFFEDDRDMDGRLDPIVADGTLRRDPGTGRWKAVVGTVCLVSDLTDAPDHWSHRVDWALAVAERRAS
jgi:hypothetical protein